MRICSHINNFFRLTMGALFGKQKKPPSRVTEQDKAILVGVRTLNVLLTNFHESSTFVLQQLKQQRDKLKQYQKRIEIALNKDRELARKCLATGRKE